MPPPYVWHIWPAQLWPASREQEARFLSDLQKIVKRRRRKPYKTTPRHSVTAVMYALRCGAAARILCKELPGEVPANLLAAYNLLNTRREEGVYAWQRIVETPETLNDAALVTAASRILHTPMRRILFLSKTAGTQAAAKEIQRTQTLISLHRHLVADIEAKLATPDVNSDTAIELGLQLHNPGTATLWAADHYIPQRVTDISTTRVADLLGERTVKIP